MFNYIVTIHNSEAHLSKVLAALNACRGKDSKVYAVIDGCSDGSKMIAEAFGCEIIETPDVRETMAINAALKKVPVAPYTMILQDDVILHDDEIEQKIVKAYQIVPNIGVMSLRHGANFKEDTLTNGQHASEKDVIQNEYQPYLPGVQILPSGYMTFRQVVYKSPIVLSETVLNELGGYDERFAPIAHDDTEYCIRAIRAGYQNVICAFDVEQPPEWGGTRRFAKKHEEVNVPMHEAHMNLIRELYPKELSLLSANPITDTIQIC